MKKVLMHIIIVLSSMSLLYSQKAQSTSTGIFNPENRIGISGSMISGYGLTYQRNFDPLAIKFVLFYYYYKNGDGTKSMDQTSLIGPTFDYNDKQSLASFGLEFKYYAFKSKYVNLYPFIGAAYWSNHTSNMNYNYTSENNITKVQTYNLKDNSDTYNVGLGVGIELMAGKYVAFNFDVGMKYLGSNITRDFSYPVVTKNLEDIYVGIAVGGGITFAF